MLQEHPITRSSDALKLVASCFFSTEQGLLQHSPWIFCSTMNTRCWSETVNQILVKAFEFQGLIGLSSAKQLLKELP